MPKPPRAVEVGPRQHVVSMASRLRAIDQARAAIDRDHPREVRGAPRKAAITGLSNAAHGLHRRRSVPTPTPLPEPLMSPTVRALLVVPPLLEYSAGPLLGPALLVAAARAAGHEADVLDLSIRWIRSHLPSCVAASPSTTLGDHDKPGTWPRAFEDA